MKEPRYRVENGKRHFPYSHLELINYEVWRLGVCKVSEVVAALKANYGRDVCASYVSQCIANLVRRRLVEKVARGVFSPMATAPAEHRLFRAAPSEKN